MDTEGLADLGHAFISYVRQDMAQVERLDRDLRLAGIHVWRDVRDLWPGEPWKIKIREAIRHRSFAFLVCFSGNSLAKQKTYQ